jgi:dihydroorotase
MLQVALPDAMCYPDPAHDPHHDLAQRFPIMETGSVTDLQQELVAHAKAAARAKAVYDREMKHVRRLLPVVRAADPKLKVVELEDMIEHVYDRGTISRMTAEAAGKSGKAPAQS